MRRHELDLTSLVAGVVLLAIAVTYLIGSLTDTRIPAAWVLPLGLIGLGLAGLVGGVAVARRTTPAPDEPVTAPSTDGGDEERA